MKPTDRVAYFGPTSSNLGLTYGQFYAIEEVCEVTTGVKLKLYGVLNWHSVDLFERVGQPTQEEICCPITGRKLNPNTLLPMEDHVDFTKISLL